ncbi:MAG: DUF4386 domain-containing protein [Anaerolineales bacterium]|nr:DUF4386 domain-containing protein [Anaerolineales bacterium]
MSVNARTVRSTEIPRSRQAGIAGFWYLLMAVRSGFAMMFVDKQVVVPGDAGATAANILASEGLSAWGSSPISPGRSFSCFRRWRCTGCCSPWIIVRPG